MNLRNVASKATGSSNRKILLNVSWLGIPWRRRRNLRSDGSLASPKSAMSWQPSAPQSTAAKLMSSTSQRSCRAFGALGSGTLAKNEPKSTEDLQPTCGVLSRIHRSLIRHHPNRQMRFPCPLAGGGRREAPGGGSLHTESVSCG